MSGILPGMCWLQPVFAACWREEKKPLNKQKKKKRNLESKDKCVPLVFIWTETAEKKVGTGGNSYIPEKQSRPALSPELSSPFKWLLIKRDAVPTVTSLSRGFTADLSPTRVTIGPSRRWTGWHSGMDGKIVGIGWHGSVGGWTKKKPQERSMTVAAKHELRNQPRLSRTTTISPGLSEIWREIGNPISKDILAGEKGHWLSAGPVAWS